MESRSLRFAATARTLSDVARRDGYDVPSFRSPPHVAGRMRTIRHHRDGSATVSVMVRGRPWSAVVADMIEGFVVLNDFDARSAEVFRDLAWSAVEDVEVAEAA